ncbi:hypothetical protein PVAND_015882 [Polypedilum vanderplanki]|uniref:Uncharacterized protein n=1 Tax=Polypedilum vanderplanki TaxID=319348 RepID=A0A9J6BDV0_POLVA|nr:hypothetical protein PVAND_015882 [Polypedilum vanderplanki]
MIYSNFKTVTISIIFIFNFNFCTSQHLHIENNAFIRKNDQSRYDTQQIYNDTYFRDLIKSLEANATRSSESSSDDITQITLKKILTEERLDKMETRMTGELRKMNNKLMKIEEHLKNLTGKIENLIKTEINAMKEEILKELKENSNKK